MYAFQPIAFGKPSVGGGCPPDLAYVGGTRNNQVDDVVSLDFSTFNIGCTATSWSATGLPTGLSINSSTGLISGVCSSSSIFVVNITATNSAGSDNASFNWSVTL